TRANNAFSMRDGGYLIADGPYMEMGYTPVDGVFRIDHDRVSMGYIGGSRFEIQNRDWLDFFGKFGMPPFGQATFARGNLVIPRVAGAFINFGWTYTGGTLFGTLGAFFTVGAAFPYVMNGRSNSGISVLANNPIPGGQYEISYFMW